MSSKILSHFPGDQKPYPVYFQHVDKCPICGTGIIPALLADSLYENNKKEIQFTTLELCPSCYNSFVVHYKTSIIREGAPVVSSSRAFEAILDYIGPLFPQREQFDDRIRLMSPYFCDLYDEAIAAEQYYLTGIAGVGYRKALEFLIKDFAISQNPDKADEIKRRPINQCINDYIDNDLLKTAVTRAVWLGNDQTHYSTKFTDKSIEDLKSLIRLTLHWISMILETQDAEKIQPKK